MPDTVSPEELQTFRNEAYRDSQFDPLKLRRNLWEMTDMGKGQILAQSCAFAKVLWIQPHGTQIEPDWDSWGRIFQWVSYAPVGKWVVYWYPAHIKRVLPPRGHPVGPQNINGGYCFPCNPQSIVVYRYEEATRVLIHELLHAACLDPPNAELETKEATTETWAELLLVAFCSKGNELDAARLWRLQSQWIANQNQALQKSHHVKSKGDYAWRYTLGREEILNTLKVNLPTPKQVKGNSSRLTHPQLCV